MAATEYRNRSGEPVRVGDVVDVLSFGVEGVEGGTVVGLSVVRGTKRARVPMARIERADGSTFAHRVLFLEPVK